MHETGNVSRKSHVAALLLVRRLAGCEAHSLPRCAPSLAHILVVSDQTGPDAGLPNGVNLEDLRTQHAAREPEPADVVPDDLAAAMFTSGSTGRPRGVMVASRNIVANTESIMEYLALTSADRMMVVLPFHYCFGTSLLHTHLRAGGSLVLEARFMYPEQALKRMLETACTGFAGVPSHYQILLRRSRMSKMQFPHLRHVRQAGGHLAPIFLQELRDALPATQIFVMYGQTEATARLSYLPPPFLQAKLGSVGKGIPGVKLTVVDESGQAVMPGQIGEIVAEGDEHHARLLA